MTFLFLFFYSSTYFTGGRIEENLLLKGVKSVFKSNLLCLEKLGFHIRRFRLNVNNVHYVRGLPKWGSDIFIYIRRLGPYFWVQNFEFEFLFFSSEK